MSIRSLSGAALIAAGLSFAPVSPAQAADDAFCKEYARAAVNQVRTAAKHRRCESLLEEGPRWTANYKVHYDWCRDVHRDKARAERNERKLAIEDCTRRR